MGKGSACDWEKEGYDSIFACTLYGNAFSWPELLLHCCCRNWTLIWGHSSEKVVGFGKKLLILAQIKSVYYDKVINQIWTSLGGFGRWI